MEDLEALNEELFDAAESGDLKAAEKCLKNGADVRCRRSWNEQTPLHVALEKKHKDMATLLVSKGADIKIQYNFVLFNAAKSGDLKAAEECLKNGADVNYIDRRDKQTPLHVALENNDKDMAALLVSKGADIKIQYDFFTPFSHFSSRPGI